LSHLMQKNKIKCQNNFVSYPTTVKQEGIRNHSNEFSSTHLLGNSMMWDVLCLPCFYFHLTLKIQLKSLFQRFLLDHNSVFFSSPTLSYHLAPNINGNHSQTSCFITLIHPYIGKKWNQLKVWNQPWRSITSMLN